MHFGEKEIKLQAADISIVLKIEPDSVGPEAPCVLFWNSLAASDRQYSLHHGPIKI